MSVIRLGLALPAYGGDIAAQQSVQWLQMGFALANSPERFALTFHSVLDVCGVEVARNKAVADAIASNAVDWLLFCDADTWHDDAFDILTGISDADRYPAAVYAAAVPRRGGIDTHLTVYKKDEGLGKTRIPLEREELEGKKLIEIESAGTALMAININFVKHRMPRPWFQFSWIEGSTEFLSEDRNFCLRARAAGGLVVTDGRYIAKHRNRPEVI